MSLVKYLVSTTFDIRVAFLIGLLENVWESGAHIEDIDIRVDQSIPWSFQRLMAQRNEPHVLETDKWAVSTMEFINEETDGAPGISLNLCRRLVTKSLVTQMGP